MADRKSSHNYTQHVYFYAGIEYANKVTDFSRWSHEIINENKPLRYSKKTFLSLNCFAGIS